MKENPVFKNMMKCKTPDELIDEGSNSELKKTLNVFDLIVIGIGAVVGTGIFSIVGVAAQGGADGVGAGPALVISMVIAAIACVFSALCYSEFASMIPVAGSAYTYTYATMGEFMAWMVGFILMLEYAIGNITVACAWTGYLFQLLKGFSHILPAWLVNPPIWLVSDYRSAVHTLSTQGVDPQTVIPSFCGLPFSINLPAALIILFITGILIKGTKDSTKMAAFMVALKLGIIGLFVFTGLFFVEPSNWTPFAPNGFSGIFMGAFIIFFA